MKKTLLIVLAVALVFVAVIGFTHFGAAQEETPEASAAPVEASAAPAETAEPAQRPSIDLEALHARYPAASVYATVGDRQIRWEEYYEWLGTYILSAESYIDSMATYGMSISWSDNFTDDATLADYIVANLSDNFRAYTGIELFAAANGVVISEEELAAKREEDKLAALGEGATDEDWAQLLVANYMTENIYRAQSKAQLELTKVQEQLYGENGEKISLSRVQHYIEDEGYLRCNHILFLTKDMDTYQDLDEETIAAKKAQAEAIAAELQSITDREELLARFAELKDELCEDSGKIYNPDGYLFTPGTMVQIFEDTTAALAEYQVSDPVLSEYGYHIIIRLPIGVDTALDTGGTIGSAAAAALMAEDLDKIVDGLDFQLAPGVEPFNLLDYLVEFSDK